MNLLREIYERLEFDRLISEGKDPVEVLHHKYQHVPSQIIDDIIKIDPTKKKSYSQWLLSKWNDEYQTIVNNLRNGRIEKLFQHYKNHQDIQIKDCPSVEEGLRDFVPEEDTVLTKSTEPTTYVTNLGKEVDSELANDFDIVFNQDNWIIAVPNTYEAECKLGENMQWCTANCYGNGLYYYERYLRDYGGKYYVNFDMSNGDSANGKDYPYTRYQFHFESKQLMDKNDDPIDVDYIEIPDSALKFYESEGFDVSQFENEEERYERYSQARYNDSYDLNDDLRLMVQFDDDYEFNEPNENTEYYVYDENDDRDPIIWTEIPNPHLNDVVIVNTTGEYFILKTTREDRYLLIMNTDNSSYRDWEGYDLVNFLEVPYGGVVGIDPNKNVNLYTHYGEETFQHAYIEGGEDVEMFVNKTCFDEKYDGYFVEIANSDGYHTLLYVADDNIAKCVVKKDVPFNGKYFEMDKNGLVVGMFRKYRVYEDDEYEEDATYINYDFEDNLPNGDYLVSTISDSKKMYNILTRHTRQLLLPKWFPSFQIASVGLYVFATTFDPINRRFVFFNQEGQQIGDEYEGIGYVDNTHHIFYGGSYGKCNLISGDDGKIILSCVSLVTKQGINGKIIVVTDITQDTKTPVTKCFDYVKREFCHEEVTHWKRIVSTNNNIWICSTLNSDGDIIFKLSTDKPIATGVTNIKHVDGYSYYYFIISKSNGKQNVLDIEHGILVLPDDVNEVLDYSSVGRISYTMGDSKTYVYNYVTKQMEINPNGIELPTKLSYTGDVNIASTNSNYKLCFASKSGSIPLELSVWYDLENSSIYSSKLDKNTPQEVITSYNIITGQQVDVTEQFKNMMRRINEATKLSRIDFID